MKMVKVKTADSSDLNEVAHLFTLYREFYTGVNDKLSSTSFIEQRIKNKDSRIFVAYMSDDKEKKLRGFVQLYPSFSSISAKPIFILNDLYVEKNSRTKGVAKALMTAARDYALQQKAKGLSLSTAHDNDTAKRLYEQLGYVQDTTFHHYFLSIE